MNEPSLKQKEAIEYLTNAKTNFIGYGGAAFGGKSYLLCTWITNMALLYDDTGWGIGRKELVTLKKTTLKTLFKVFTEMNLGPDDYNYNGQLNVIRFKNGSEIFLIDTAYKPSDPLYTRFGGYELTGAAIDESAETPLEAIQILFTRLGRRNNAKYGLQKKLLETFNPVKNHVYFRYFKPHRDGYLPETYSFIKALPQDNPSPEVEEYVAGIINNSDRVTIERLIYGNFEYDDDPTLLINYDAALNLFTNTFVDPPNKEGKHTGRKYITADIAFHGSDMFVAYTWSGWRIIDAVFMQKCDAKEVEKTLKALAVKHHVPQTQIAYDADGLGSYLKGYLANARSFNNGSSAIEEQGKKVSYYNLKSQCYFHISEKINASQVYVEPQVAEMKINNKFVQEHISDEVAAIKRDNSNLDGRLKVISKHLMKSLIGHSPDYMDAMMMRALFDLKKVNSAPARATVIRND